MRKQKIALSINWYTFQWEVFCCRLLFIQSKHLTFHSKNNRI